MATRKTQNSAQNTELSSLMLADVKRSALTPQDAAKLNLSVVPATLAAEWALPSATDGYKIPYFDLDGKQTEFFRVRYLKDTRKGFAAYTDKKPIKYGQVPNTVNEVYLSPLTPWRKILAGAAPLVITEGEKKAACACKHGIPTIGLGGVWCFTSKRAGARLLPIFKDLNLEGREVLICFDSDALTNPNIVAAENVLAMRLGELGAVVKIARIPGEDDGKVGMDDYIVKHGPKQFFDEVLKNAEPHEGNTALHQMNEKVVYVRNPGLIYDYENQMRMSPTNFTGHAYANAFHDEQIGADQNGLPKYKRVATADKWLKWQARAELKRMVYRPGEATITLDGCLNGWQGWGFGEPVKGDVSAWIELLDHIFGAEHEARIWFERWAACPIRNPGVKMSVASLIWGVTEGSGKSLVGYVIGSLYGKNFTEIDDDRLEDERREWAENKQFILADDITGHNNRKFANKLKTMITRKELWLNPKHVASYSVDDVINYYFTSNDPDALFLSDGDRRFFVFMTMAQKIELGLKKRVLKLAETEQGRTALAYHFLTLDMGDFDPYAEALETQAKREMKYIAKSELGAWVLRLKEDAHALLNGNLEKFGEIMTAEELNAIYDPMGEKRTTVNALARELTRAGFVKPATGNPLRTRSGMKRAYAVVNPSKWQAASWAEASEYFAKMRGEDLEAEPPKRGRKKF